MFEAAWIRLRGWGRTMVGIAGVALFVACALGLSVGRSSGLWTALPESARSSVLLQSPLLLFIGMMVGLAVAIRFAWGSGGPTAPESM
jgi:hypothetical protein